MPAKRKKRVVPVDVVAAKVDVAEIVEPVVDGKTKVVTRI
jgi:hypothetical protein